MEKVNNKLIVFGWRVVRHNSFCSDFIWSKQCYYIWGLGLKLAIIIDKELVR